MVTLVSSLSDTQKDTVMERKMSTDLDNRTINSVLDMLWFQFW